MMNAGFLTPLPGHADFAIDKSLLSQRFLHPGALAFRSTLVQLEWLPRRGKPHN